MKKSATVEMGGAQVGELTLIDVAELDVAAWNARRAMDEDAIAGLQASIEKDGLVQPIVVRERGARFEVVCGARRLTAVKRLRWNKIPSIVIEADDRAARLMNLVENIQREGLSPMEEGEAFVRMVKDDGMDPREIAVMVGKEHNLSYVYQRMQLTRLAGGGRKLLDKGEISLGAAVMLARLTERDRDLVLKEYADRKKQSGVQWAADLLKADKLREWIEENLYLRLGNAPFDLSDTTLPGGACMECPKRTGSQAILFADLMADGEDRCTDRACFTGKVGAVIEGAKRANPELALLSTSYVTDGKWKGEKPLGAHQWRASKSGDSLGIVVEDASMEQLGKTIKIEILSDSADDRRSAGMDAAQKREQKKFRQRREVRMRVLKEVAEAMAVGVVVAADYPAATRAIVGRLDNDARRFFCKAMGLEVEKGKHGSPDFEKAMLAWAEDKKKSDVGVMVALAMAAHGAVHAFATAVAKKDDPLFQVAGWHRIDVEAIEADIAAETPTKKKAGAKKLDAAVEKLAKGKKSVKAKKGKG